MRALIVFCISLVLALALIPLANAQFCGDGACNSGEESWCSADCSAPAAYCGDGSCDAGEASWCSADCSASVPAPAPFCGDGTCNSGEESWCSADCVIPGFCGDGSCDSGESSWCSADCAVSPPDCTSAAWSCPDFSTISCSASGLKSRSCTLVDSACSNPDVVRPSLTQSCTPPPVTPPVVNNPPLISFDLPSFALPGSTISVSVAATDNDDYKVSRIYLVDASNNELLGTSHGCGGVATCTTTYSITVPSAYDTSYIVRVNATDAAGKVSQSVQSASTARQCLLYSSGPAYNPGTVTYGGLPSSLSGQCPALDGQAQCMSDGTWKVLQCYYGYDDGDACTPNWQCTGWSNAVNSCGTRTCSDSNSCGTPVGKPSESASCPVGVDNAPLVTSFTVPATADASSTFTVSVTATDDKGVSSIGVFNSDGSLASPSQQCSGILSCTRSFIVQAPGAFDFVFHLVAKAFDTIGQSVSASSSNIKTNPAAIPPVAPHVVSPEKVLGNVGVDVHSEALFVSGAIPDSSCLSPGAESFMFVRMGNNGASTLRDVKVTAYVPDLDLWSVSGPFSMGKGGSTSRFLPFSVPEGAPSGEYFIRIHATAGRDSVVKYRMLEVSPSC